MTWDNLIGISYWAAWAACIGLAVWLPNRLAWKVTLSIGVMLVFALPLIRQVDALRRGALAQKQGVASQSAKSQKALRLFDERCKTAGLEIKRTAPAVDAVVWLRWRTREDNAFEDQWGLHDPYGRDCVDRQCVANLLKPSKVTPPNSKVAEHYANRFSVVEAATSAEGGWYRYTATLRMYPFVEERARKPDYVALVPDYEFQIEAVPIDKPTARYGLTWEDLSTREDREHWIAGGALRVIDRLTDEVLSERRGFMVDLGQGERGTAPWVLAQDHACPSFATIPNNGARRARTGTETLDFARQVLLKPE